MALKSKTYKERIWAIVNQLPFKAFPHRLIVEMVYNVTFWMNAFPHNYGVHEVMSPRTILTGLHIDHNKHCTLEFGSYAQIHEEHDNFDDSATIGSYSLVTHRQNSRHTLFLQHKFWQIGHPQQLDSPTNAN